MCLPDYIYGLILIESLGHEGEQNALRSPDHAISRNSRTIWRRREKKFPTGLTDADNVVAAGA